MAHIGMRIREKRTALGKSAEWVANRLTKPITKQAFTQKERLGSFSFEEVEEVAVILECDMVIFLPSKSTNSGHEQAATTEEKAG